MPYSMQLTEQIPNDLPGWGRKVLLLAIIPVPHGNNGIGGDSDRIDGDGISGNGIGGDGNCGDGIGGDSM